MNQYYLQHHGILGQKWGVRRFQNKDGTLTEVGKKRYNAGQADANNLATKLAFLEDSNRTFVNELSKSKAEKLLVPSDLKKAFSDGIKAYADSKWMMEQKYGEITDSIITRNGRDYAYILINDKLAQVGYESLVELHVKEVKGG